MFDIITKADYWSYMDQKFVRPNTRRLKNAQDGYVRDRLKNETGTRVLELGGGESRVLDALAAAGNETWNADDFAGGGNGPTELPESATHRIVPTLVGNFSSELPDNYFDFVFSVSVIEHVPGNFLKSVFADSCRVLKPGGTMFHAIDLYLYDDHSTNHAARQADRIKSYMDIADGLPLALVTEPAISADVTFSTRFAANSDEQLYSWSVSFPDMRDIRASAQNVSLKCEWRRTDEPFDWTPFLPKGDD